MRTGPDFVILGAAKAATSSLFRYLTTHDDVGGVVPKETNHYALDGHPPSFAGPGDDDYINRDSVWHPDEYRRLFESRPEPIVGEASPIYLYDPRVPARLRRDRPDARLVAVLRHPVDRCHASFLHLRRDEREPFSSFAEALEAEPDRIDAGWEFLWHYRAVSRYGEQLERWAPDLESGRLRLWAFDDLVADPQRVTREVLAHLGAPGAEAVELPHAHRHNVTGEARSRALQRALRDRTGVGRLARAIVPPRARRRVRAAVNRVNLSRPTLDPALRTQLVREFVADVDAAEACLGRPLNAWHA